jgi:hypothetical protein
MTDADISRLTARLEAHTDACVHAGRCRAGALRMLRDQNTDLALWDLTVLMNSAIVAYGTDADWNDRMLRAGYLPIRADETYPY